MKSGAEEEEEEEDALECSPAFYLCSEELMIAHPSCLLERQTNRTHLLP